jgi:protein-L-isoaspartate(D-aspartate) O-methyltransferase
VISGTSWRIDTVRSVLLALVLLCTGTGGVAMTNEDSDFAPARMSMVNEQIAARGIKDPAVLEAMRRVPRHRFVPIGEQRYAYHDTPLPIGHGQTISQPYIVALMTELVRPHPQARVLEVGTGSGYQAAVLAEIVERVFTIEIEADLARSAAALLDDLGYDNVTVRAGDGYNGWPEHAPFDIIVVTAAPDHVPQALMDQLKPGGRMVIPVGPVHAVQELRLLEKDEAGKWHEKDITPVRFVPLRREDPRE